MTKETIIDNCNRLMAFYKQKPISGHQINETPSCQDLIVWHGRCLDINGAPRMNLSVLYIPIKEEFEEFKSYCKDGFGEGFVEHNSRPVSDEVKKEVEKIGGAIMPIPYFHFKHDGYYWEVLNR